MIPGWSPGQPQLNSAAAAATAAPTTGGPPGVRVRRATLADLPLLAPWLHAAFPSEEPEVRLRVSMALRIVRKQRATEQLRRCRRRKPLGWQLWVRDPVAYERRHHCVLVACDATDGQPLGCATMTVQRLRGPLSPWRGYLKNLLVHPDARRRGVGGRLLRACETLCVRWRLPDLWLRVQQDNAAALALYRRAGYEVQPWAAALPGQRPPEYRTLCKELPPPTTASL